MVDPYRHSSEAPAEEVLARRSPWIVGATIAVTAAGSIAPLFADTLARWNDVVGLAAWLFSPFAVFLFTRSLRRLTIPQRIAAHESGLRLAWPEGRSFVGGDYGVPRDELAAMIDPT